jgi:hypothetical protein
MPTSRILMAFEREPCERACACSCAPWSCSLRMHLRSLALIKSKHVRQGGCTSSCVRFALAAQPMGSFHSPFFLLWCTTLFSSYFGALFLFFKT